MIIKRVIIVRYSEREKDTKKQIKKYRSQKSNPSPKNELTKKKEKVQKKNVGERKA